MKGTKIMLSFLGTMFMTWMTLAILNYMFSSIPSFRVAATENWIAFIMLVFGWIPSLVVSIDLEEKLS